MWPKFNHCNCCDIKTLNFLLWWRHQMETSSALLAHFLGDPPVTGGFPSQRQVTGSFSFDLRQNKRLSKQSRLRWFETPSPSLGRHCNVIIVYYSGDWYWTKMVWVSVNSNQIHDVIKSNHYVETTFRELWWRFYNICWELRKTYTSYVYCW